MNFINKKRITMCLIIVLALTNLYQFNKLHNYKELIESNDYKFKLSLKIISNSIESLELKRFDDFACLAHLSSSVGQSYAIYDATSYYNENKLLSRVLWDLNNNISNKNNIKEVLDENDLTVLIPALKKLEENPQDSEATEELSYLVKKYTVIGSTLP
ncbi:hypothetical protein [Clostridium culturomicium]|uniref:hypothetical protein n=1 Tax=Clostridium culturomicium TaxID=1499683 RepID=UPI0038576F6B